MNRRTFLRTAGGATAGTAAFGAAGRAGAQEGTATPGGGTGPPGGDGESGGGGGVAPPPANGPGVSDTGNFEGTTADRRGQSAATVMVGTEGNGGSNAFTPPAIHVDAGTTVLFEWTGDGFHNVVEETEGWRSGDPVGEAGVNYEHTFEEAGIAKYYCDPHLQTGMKGAVVVGDDYPSVDTGGSGSTPVNPEHMGVPFQAHFVGLATIVAILVTLVFTFFQLKYAESPNTKGGND
jgi:halocyanin-like protein